MTSSDEEKRKREGSFGKGKEETTTQKELTATEAI